MCDTIVNLKLNLFDTDVIVACPPCGRKVAMAGGYNPSSSTYEKQEGAFFTPCVWQEVITKLGASIPDPCPQCKMRHR
jgi:hypothetical protein